MYSHHLFVANPHGSKIVGIGWDVCFTFLTLGWKVQEVPFCLDILRQGCVTSEVVWTIPLMLLDKLLLILCRTSGWQQPTSKMRLVSTEHREINACRIMCHCFRLEEFRGCFMVTLNWADLNTWHRICEASWYLIADGLLMLPSHALAKNAHSHFIGLLRQEWMEVPDFGELEDGRGSQRYKN